MARSLDEARAALQEARERRDRLMTDLGGVQSRARNGEADAGLQERADNLNRGIASADADIEQAEAEVRELEDRHARVTELATSGAHREDGAAFHTPPPATRTDPPGSPAAARSEALRAVEQLGDRLASGAGDRLTGLVERDRSGLDSRYLAAVADPAYERAFARRLASPDDAVHAYTSEEAEAMRRVAQVASERAMSLADANGGFAVPASLDPTIILTSDGSTNPLRRLATITTIATDEWKGVASDGVTASFAAEATEATDDSPTLTQPTIKPEKAHAFVPFSIEVGMDWTALAQEMARLFADARDNLEAEKFLSGTGTDEPEGLIAGLAATSVIESSGTSLVADDVYVAQETLPARFQPRAAWLSSNTVANRVHRFSGPNATEPPLFNENRDRLLGKPWHEVSGMDTGDTTGQNVLAYGDIGTGYRIVDRIGMTVELVAHLFGANRRPTGERGLYAYWRVGAAVVADNAIRVLQIGDGV